MASQLLSSLKEMVCGIEEVPLAFTLIFASVRMEKFAVLVIPEVLRIDLLYFRKRMTVP